MSPQSPSPSKQVGSTSRTRPLELLRLGDLLTQDERDIQQAVAR